MKPRHRGSGTFSPQLAKASARDNRRYMHESLTWGRRTSLPHPFLPPVPRAKVLRCHCGSVSSEQFSSDGTTLCRTTWPRVRFIHEPAPSTLTTLGRRRRLLKSKLPRELRCRLIRLLENPPHYPLVRAGLTQVVTACSGRPMSRGGVEELRQVSALTSLVCHLQRPSSIGDAGLLERSLRPRTYQGPSTGRASHRAGPSNGTMTAVDPRTNAVARTFLL
jgi:hypothetical protein